MTDPGVSKLPGPIFLSSNPGGSPVLALSYYMEFCGPTALASATGRSRRIITRDLFSKRLLDVNGGTHLDAFRIVLGVKYHKQPKWYPKRNGAQRYPTVSQWLREHPVGSYVLHTCSRRSYHALHIEDGVVKADANKDGSERHRVEGFWPVRWGPS